MYILLWTPCKQLHTEVNIYFRYQTGGTILAGKLALDRGWAINIGGGFHHCSAERGGGFCAYADITLLIRFLFYYFPKKVKQDMLLSLI